MAAFKKSKKDSLYYQTESINQKYEKLYLDSLYFEPLNKYFDKIDPTLRIGAGFSFKRHYLHLALYSKLNNIPIDYGDILNSCQVQWNNFSAEFEKKQEPYRAQSRKIMLDNDKKCKIGSVFSVMLPVEGQSTGGYRSYPYSLDYSEVYDDSLKIKGQLISKEYLKGSNNDTIDIICKVKILRLSNPKYEIAWKKCKIGDVFTLPLAGYARPI